MGDIIHPRARPAGAGRRALVGAGLALAAAAGIRTAAAQEWPARPVRFIVPFPTGGTTDVIGRLITEHLRGAFGQPFVVENRPGAGGNVGVDAIAKSEADGYTIGLATVGPLAINVSLFSRLPYDPRRDLQGITLIARSPNLLVVPSASPVRTLQDLIAAAKARPGGLNYGSPGNGTTGHLSGELLKTRLGLDILHVPFAGNAAVHTALLRGDVQFTFDSMATAVPQVRAGAFRALAVTSRERWPALPEVPTMIEAGVADFEMVPWFCIIGPARMPRPVVDRLNVEIHRALAKPEVEARFIESFGMQVALSTPDELSDLIAREIPRWREVIQAAGARVD
ncbi:MFS transporter [Caldovatus sediminis]|uniref:MFS transporter n=1 Tax=Caldovatus sediminis TaxID=2041189 RepID=A0A8J2ZBZ8_9PROT|nr:tripartite tricarboxylate transporter substrate binding protein [Caldovatus sediminis]GGG37237.1 MFS transporter [Caldovatus sediminis]